MSCNINVMYLILLARNLLMFIKMFQCTMLFTGRGINYKARESYAQVQFVNFCFLKILV